jgi:hypothetical protein
MWCRFVLAATLLFAGATSSAQERVLGASGLETDNHKKLLMTVTVSGDKPEDSGLSEDKVKTKVELVLRSVGVIPTTLPGSEIDMEMVEDLKRTFLDVEVNTIGKAFRVTLIYARIVSYPARGKLYVTLVKAWSTQSYGIHAGNGSFVMSKLEEQAEKFANEYLKANEE